MTRVHPIRSALLFALFVVAMTLFLGSLPHLAHYVHAEPGVVVGSGSTLDAPPAPDPIDAAGSAVATGWDEIRLYGPLWGVALLIYTFLSQFLKANESSHRIAQGRTLALITTATMMLGAVVIWKYRGGDTAGLLMSLFMAIKMLVSPTVQAPAAAPARAPQAGRARLVMLLALAVGPVLVAAPLIILSSCAATQARVDPVVAGVVNCAKADLPAAKALGLQLATEALASVFAGKGVPWVELEAEAEAAARVHGVAVGSCAFGDLIAELGRLLPPPAAGERSFAAAPASPLDAGRAALGTLKGKLGVTAIDTGAGVM